MSIEKTLSDLTEAINGLTEKIDTLTKTASVPTVKSEAKKEEPKKEEPKKEEPKKEEPKKEEPKEEPKEAPKKDKPKSKTVPYDTVKKETLAFVRVKGREGLQEVFAQFGRNVNSAKDLEEDQYQEYLDMLKAGIEEEDVT